MPRGVPALLNPKNDSVRRKALLEGERDRLPQWLDEHLPRGPERVQTIKQLRRKWQYGASRETLASEFALPLAIVKRLCRYRASLDPCPKHNGQGLYPCSPDCPGCAWEVELLARLGDPPPPADNPLTRHVPPSYYGEEA